MNPREIIAHYLGLMTAPAAIAAILFSADPWQLKTIGVSSLLALLYSSYRGVRRFDDKVRR